MPKLKTPKSTRLPADYATARDTFLNTAKAAGATLKAHPHTLFGPAGEVLATDCAWIGPPNPAHLLIISSGTHGVEGGAGSLGQTALLDQLPDLLPANTATLMIHAVNPWGFAHDRRVNENNVDLNRNFLPSFQNPPKNPHYLHLHDMVCPPHWTDETQAAARAAMRAYAKKHGPAALQAALSSGQYVEPMGVFYGGTAPEWSNRTLRNILDDLPASLQKTIFIDIHTGLGPFGIGELILEIPDTAPMAALARAIFGKGVASTTSGDSVSAALQGPMDFAVHAALGADKVLFTALEFGTVPQKHVFAALQADNWLHMHGDLQGRAAPAIKQQIRAAFRPDEISWTQAVTDRTFEVVNRALTGFSAVWPNEMP
ncbi:MAG: M14 family metallopeptidase [Alphaproteobacteria bacterium]